MFIDALVPDGRLPPWHEWWPAETFAQLLPDEASFYGEPVPLPEVWWRRPAAYLQLSPAYDQDRSRAMRWGWPIRRLNGHHLDLVTRPDTVAELVTPAPCVRCSRERSADLTGGVAGCLRRLRTTSAEPSIWRAPGT